MKTADLFKVCVRFEASMLELKKKGYLKFVPLMVLKSFVLKLLAHTENMQSLITPFQLLQEFVNRQDKQRQLA